MTNAEFPVIEDIGKQSFFSAISNEHIYVPKLIHISQVVTVSNCPDGYTHAITHAKQ